jgi:PAS domain S-box-containing protein
MRKISVLKNFIARPRSLRFKVVAAIGSVFSLLFITQYTIVKAIVMNNYNTLERAQVKLNIERLKNTLTEEQNKLDNITSDYAQWDDTYEFAVNPNPEYLTNGIGKNTLSNLKVNLLVIFNSKADLMVQKGWDIEAKRRIPLPKDFVQSISQPSPLRSILLNHPQIQDKTIGFIDSTAGPIMVASRPILTSDGNGPAHGTFMFGKFLDQLELKNLSKKTQQQIQLFSYTATNLPPDVQSKKSNWRQTPITTQVLDEQRIAGYLVIKDLQGYPLVILRSQSERQIYAQAKDSLTYYFWCTLAIGGLVCLVSLLLLEHFVLSRLNRLSQEVMAIGEGGSGDRVTLPAGKDELSSFAKVLNQTLDRLDKIQQDLQTSEERYNLAVHGSNDGIWDWQLGTQLIYLSDQCKDILGCFSQQNPTRIEDCFERVHPEDLNDLKAAIENHLAGNTPYFQHEHRIQDRQDGSSYRWVLYRGLAIFDQANQPYRMAGSITDITDRKCIEEALARKSVELQRSNQELEQFAYIASHDLQEPLRKIEAFGDRLHSRYSNALGEQGTDYIQRMQNAAGRMRGLIQDLLAFSRVSSQSRSFIATDLNTVVQAVLSDLEVQIQELKAEIKVADLPTIEADATQMRQLCQNLIGNALKFHRPDIAPVVNIGWEPTSITLSADQSLAVPGIRLAIADNGIGFDTQYLDRIFKVFQRLHGRTEYKGTGIGLAVCAKIVEGHGGQITAQSIPNQGATFFVTLPCSQSALGEKR